MDVLVSVIMSTYNETKKELEQAIESILQQSYKNIELVIVNDNPDNIMLLDLLNKYAIHDSRVKIIQNEKNIGLASSLNKAISHSNGKYIARMDADDISVSNRIEIQCAYLENHPDCDMVSANRIDIGEESEQLGTFTDFHIPDTLIPTILPYGTVIIHPTVMLRAELYREMEGYNNFRAAQDYDLWLRIVSAEKTIHIIPEKLLYYRIRSNSITSANFLRQYLYTKFAIDKYKKRKRGIKIANKYTDDEVNQYLISHGINDQNYVNSFNGLYHNVHKLFDNKDIVGFILLIPQMLRYREVVKALIREFRFKRCMARWNN